MRAMSEAKAPSRHYPAPYALIDLWAAYGGDPGTMKGKEIESFARLLRSDTAQNLMRVCFLRQSMKNLASKEADIRHVHVIGAGEMGSDIAAWCAMQGMRVTLSDQEVAPLGKTVRKTVALCHDQHKQIVRFSPGIRV
jgi:3-hydroxyacyl-CoA dehydrogenase / enoyl-CoA hydratase / 3-hydroxybutyryl-CoA epimerase